MAKQSYLSERDVETLKLAARILPSVRASGHHGTTANAEAIAVAEEFMHDFFAHVDARDAAAARLVTEARRTAPTPVEDEQ